MLQYWKPEVSPWNYSMPALNSIPSGIDSMSISLRHLSVHLEELKLNNTHVPPQNLSLHIFSTVFPKYNSLHSHRDRFALKYLVLSVATAT